jgi:hypothetical protein
MADMLVRIERRCDVCGDGGIVMRGVEEQSTKRYRNVT